MNSLASHGSICASTKDPHSLSLRQKMEGYLEDLHSKVGLKRMVTLKMIRLGYFHFTINPNSKLNKIRKGMRCSIIYNTYVHLEAVMILGYVKVHTIEVITIQI